MRTKLVEFRSGRSQAEMGAQYGVSQQAWSYWERGAKSPSPFIMKRIADDSGVPMEILFCDVFNKDRLLK
ncbi:helix-turn-helix transcriptional regulator [Sporomusa sp.]|uniref:helix-turn-helix domain-containing protein n=1 Tax=Sporomusa sp. TaxID=2078658 RepID=UPI002BDCE23F|nr:helix-turn-helix transcriptional regulator [Sporomusa sp.]HWR08028.1 helix-turn-helix transcriptional regulator [Sporomusa sp.]